MGEEELESFARLLLHPDLQPTYFNGRYPTDALGFFPSRVGVGFLRPENLTVRCFLQCNGEKHWTRHTV